VVIAILKKVSKLKASLIIFLQILLAAVFEKTQISCALQPEVNTSELHDGVV
jgi:hypothetical protein